jgi:hypothetical protein
MTRRASKVCVDLCWLMRMQMLWECGVCMYDKAVEQGMRMGMVTYAGLCVCACACACACVCWRMLAHKAPEFPEVLRCLNFFFLFFNATSRTSCSSCCVSSRSLYTHYYVCLHALGLFTRYISRSLLQYLKEDATASRATAYACAYVCVC